MTSKSMAKWTVESYRYCIVLFIFSVLILVRDLNLIKIPPLLFTAYSVGVFLIFPLTYSIGFLMFSFPFHGGLGFNQIVVSFITIYFIKGYRTLSFSRSIVYPYLILIIELSHYYNTNSNILTYVRWAVYIIVVVLLLQDRNSRCDVGLILKSYCIGTLCAGAIVLTETIHQLGVSSIIHQAIRIGELNADNSKYHIYFDANELGMYLDVSISIVLTLFAVGKLGTLWTYLTVLSSAVIGFTTLSKAFFITLVFVILVYSLFNLKNLILKLSSWSLLLASAISIYAITPYITPLINNFKARFQMADQSNGRISIAVHYFDKWSQSSQSILFGNGLQHYHDGAWMGADAHNGTEEILLSWGIIGFILVVTWFLALYRNQKHVAKAHKIRKITLLPLATLVFYVQSLQFFKIDAYILLLVVAFLPMRLTRTEHGSTVTHKYSVIKTDLPA